jgi:hypothetical protein
MHIATRLRNLSLAMLLLASGASPAMAGDDWQVGDEVPNFYVREVTSDRPNLATCLVCRYGSRPVVMVCVHKPGALAEQIVMAIDRAVDGARGQGLRGFALFTSPEPSAVPASLLRLARQGKLSLPLALPVESGGPGNLSHPAEAALTVLCYRDRKIVSRHVLSEQLTEAHLSALLADVKLLAE